MREGLRGVALVVILAGAVGPAAGAGILPDGPEAPSAGALSDGFDPAGWVTNATYAPIGDLSAKKGGRLRLRWRAFPSTLRAFGPGSDKEASRELQALVYEPLVQFHPKTLEPLGRLATHWRIDEDSGTFSFHLDPRARWADGSPVTAKDVVATWAFRSRQDLRDPDSSLGWAERYERPAAEGPLLVTVKARRPGWRAFADFASAPVLQARELDGLAGETYLAAYDERLLTGSGPYELKDGGLVKGSSLSLVRRPGYWGWGERFSAGLYNFDEISWTAVADADEAVKALREERIDALEADEPGVWPAKTDFPEARKGWVQKREIRTQGPRRLLGIAFNLRKPPFAERQARRGFTLLLDRWKAAERSLADGQFKVLESYFPGTSWASTQAVKEVFNPRDAAASLDNAGWKSVGGRLSKDGKALEVDLDYAEPAWTRTLELLKDGLESQGLRLNLRLDDPRELARRAGERDFTAMLRSWRAPVVPAPAPLWQARLADVPYSGNVPGLKDARVDRLCRDYEESRDRARRQDAIHELDMRLQRSYAQALGWYQDLDRLLYWDRLGHPSFYLQRTGHAPDIAWLWWYDPDKETALAEARQRKKPLPLGAVQSDPWSDYRE